MSGEQVKQGYKRTEVGVVPEDWEVKALGDLKPFVTSGSRGWAAFYSDRGSLFVRITNMLRDSIYLDLENQQFVNLPVESSEGTRTQLQVHDVLISITADIGIVSYVDQHVPAPAYINQHIALVRFDQTKTCSKFVSYFLASEEPQKFFRASTDTGAKAGMSLPTVQRIEVALPPLHEQRAIAAALGDVDALLDGLDRLITKKRDLKQATMQQLLTGQARLPGFSGEWEVKRLEDLFNFSGGYSASRDQLSATGYCYLHYGDIHGALKPTINTSADYQDIPKLDIPLKRVSSGSLLADGDVVFVDASEDDAGTSKHVVVVNKGGLPFIAGLHTIVAKAKTAAFANEYLQYCFQTSAIREQFMFYAVGTKVSGISKSNIVKLTLPVPSIPEQTAIATILSDMDAELSALDVRREKTRNLKQAMMQELLTGKTRLVEPASNVIPVDFSAKAKPAADDAPAAKAHNWPINEAVVVAVLVKQFGSEQYPLGRKRCTKLSYLMHRHVEHVAQGYLKKAAGPYNPSVKYKGPEGIAQKNGYIRTQASGKFSGFVAAEKMVQAEGYFEKWYGADVLTWLEQFRYKSNDELELLATIDMAVEDLRRAGKPVDVDAVKSVIHDNPEWEAKLEREIFSDANIARAIAQTKALFQ